MPYNAADIAASYPKGARIVISLTDESLVTGEYISTNSKGVNIRTEDGKVVTRALSKIIGDGYANLADRPQAADDTLEEGVEYTTRDLANVFHVSAKLLRVHLRAAGLGVGRGRKYLLRKADLADVRTRLAAE